MKHFTTEEWIDLVNQVVSPSRKRAMEEHLEGGCESCAKTVSRWQRIRRAATAEPGYQPPPGAVRIAQAAFAGSKWARKGNRARDVIEVLFDSFLQPALAGVRSAGPGTRRMLYRADPFQIDVQLEVKPGGNRIVVTGQLLDLSNPGVMAPDTRVLLSNLRGHVVHTVANQFGEFSGEIENSGDLQLTFASPSGTPIVISLREALGHLPEE